MDSPPAASPREYLKSLRKTARFQPARRTTPSSAPTDAVETSASAPLPPSVTAVSPISPSSSATTITISTPVTPTALATSSPSTQTRVRPDSESHTPASALVESFAIDKLIEALEKRRSSFTQQGQYKQAQQAHQRIQLLQTQRELVQAEALRCRHVAALLELDQASVDCLKQFHALWDEKEKVLLHYINETLQTLQERHAQEREELVAKQNDSISQPHHSKEILTLRLKELEHAKYKNYDQAIHHQEAIQMLEAQELEAHQQKQRMVHQQQLRRLEQKQSAERASLAQRHQTALAEHFRSRDVELERILARQELLKSQLISAQTKELNNSKSKRSPRLSPPMSTDSPSSPVPMTAAAAHIEFVNYIRGSRA